MYYSTSYHFKGTWRGHRDVVIKQLADDRMDSMEAYEKAKLEFFIEARILKLICHPNLVQVCACSLPLHERF